MRVVSSMSPLSSGRPRVVKVLDARPVLARELAQLVAGAPDAGGRIVQIAEELRELRVAIAENGLKVAHQTVEPIGRVVELGRQRRQSRQRLGERPVGIPELVRGSSRIMEDRGQILARLALEKLLGGVQEVACVSA